MNDRLNVPARPETAVMGKPLVADYADRAVKGEVVVLVDRAAPAEASAQSIEDALDAALATMSVKDAATFVSQTLGVARKIAYRIALDRPKG